MDRLTKAEVSELFKSAAKDILAEQAELSEDEVKAAIKEAFKELINEKAQEFGYFSLRFLGWAILTIISTAIALVALKFGVKLPIPVG